jgi:hypothetical protein
VSDSGFDLGLDDAARAGVFFVTADDIATLDMATRDAGLLARRIDLRGCANKPTLLLRLATWLDFPAGSGRNRDAASDRLRDLRGCPRRLRPVVRSCQRFARRRRPADTCGRARGSGADWAQRDIRSGPSCPAGRRIRTGTVTLPGPGPRLGPRLQQKTRRSGFP